MLVYLLVFLLSLLLVYVWNHYEKLKGLPPGPPSLPLVGSIPFLASRGAGGLILDDKIKAYGDLTTVSLGKATYIIINDFALAKELFSKDEFSGRLKTWWHQNVRGHQGRNLGIINTDGGVWQEQRRFALKQLRDLGFGRRSLDAVLVEEAEYVIEDLLEHPGQDVKVDGNFNTAVINVLWQIVASKRFDPKAKHTQDIMKRLNNQFRSGFTVYGFFPVLRKIMPLLQTDKSLLLLKDMMRQEILDHIKDIDYDSPRDFIDVYLAEIRDKSGVARTNFDIEQLVVVCLDFFQAGAETTSTTLLWSVMLMALHPEVQARCQKELDTVLGQNKPVTDDTSRLPYVMATIMEIQRVSRTAPGSLPHVLLKDTVVRGYKIPAQTNFMCNLDKFLLDPNVFEQPHTFNPDRFLSEDGKGTKKYEQFVPFGIGKRICMGESLAKHELFIFFVLLLQRLQIKVAEKHPKPEVQDFTAGITLIPNPFYVSVEPRVLQ